MRANIYRENVRQSQRCTIKTELWALFFLAFGLSALGATWYNTDVNPCDPENAGTDYWFEVCMNEGPIDLSPTQDRPESDAKPIEDEADTLTSLGRMES